jgi:hypothetical protein
MTRRIAVVLLLFGAASAALGAKAAYAQSKRVPYNVPFATSRFSRAMERPRIKFLLRQLEGFAQQELSAKMNEFKAAKGEISTPVVISRRRHHEAAIISIFVHPTKCTVLTEQITAHYAPVKGGGEKVVYTIAGDGGGDFPCK